MVNNSQHIFSSSKYSRPFVHSSVEKTSGNLCLFSFINFKVIVLMSKLPCRSGNSFRLTALVVGCIIG
mgnify:CR=1 FL=1